jgi:hypothetical protein
MRSCDLIHGERETKLEMMCFRLCGINKSKGVAMWRVIRILFVEGTSRHTVLYVAMHL